MDANCSPSTCVKSAIDTRTRRRNSDTMSSCVGSDIGRVPLEQRGEPQFVIGVPIIQLFQRQGETIIAACIEGRRGQGHKVGHLSSERETHAPSSSYYAHNRSPSMVDLSGREPRSALS